MCSFTCCNLFKNTLNEPPNSSTLRQRYEYDDDTLLWKCLFFRFGLHMLKQQQQQHIMNLLKLFIYIRLWLASYHMMGWLVTCWFSTSWKTKFFNNSTDQSSALLTDWLTGCWWVATASYLLVLKYILTLYRWCLKSQSCYIHLY